MDTNCFLGKLQINKFYGVEERRKKNELKIKLIRKEVKIKYSITMC